MIALSPLLASPGLLAVSDPAVAADTTPLTFETFDRRFSAFPGRRHSPMVAFSASPTSIASGKISMVTWSSTNVTSCTASGSWTGTKATSGTLAVSPTSTATYTLTCTGITGTSAAASTTVVVTAAPVAVNGTCGSANGTTASSAPSSNLCSTGTSSSVAGSGPWTWSCGGSNCGTTASCSALASVTLPPSSPPPTPVTTPTPVFVASANCNLSAP